MNWLSIDLGSLKTGVALWDRDRITATTLIQYGAVTRPHVRVGGISSYIRNMVEAKSITLIAVEQVINIEGRPNAPLRMLSDDIKYWARVKGVEVVQYHPSTVKAAVRVPGFGKGQGKEMMRMGVCALYGQKYRNADQNIVDAIAVGHTRLSAQREADLVAYRLIEELL
jgi:Holliday junction resolvasome RuvABC endonuclease subunit